MQQIKLEELNHWWVQKTVDPELALPFKREIYPEIAAALDRRFITALVGLRRVGKTTILYQLIQHLLERKVAVENLLFFSFDETSATWGDAIQTYQEIHQKNFREEKVYIFLDEIQRQEHWEYELKKYYDLYPKLKFIISGSESLFIKKKTKENLAGRIFEYKLMPFSFKEYLQLNKIDQKYEHQVVPFFQKFVEQGGFPETFALSERERKEYLRSLIVDKIIYKDIPKLFQLEDPEFLGVLLELVAANPGMYVDYQSLSQQFGKDRRVIKKYFFYLQSSFLISLLGNYRKGKAASLRKKKRAYPLDHAFCTLYHPGKEESFTGKVVETLIINALQAVSFCKNGTEIDIIHQDFPMEVKYQEQINSADWKPLIDFMRHFEREKGFLITKNMEKAITVPEGSITLIPAWKFVLEKV